MCALKYVPERKLTTCYYGEAKKSKSTTTNQKQQILKSRQLKTERLGPYPKSRARC